MKTDIRRTIGLGLLLLVGAPAFAQNKSTGTLSYSQLPAREQSLLKAAENLWPQLDADAQLQLRAQARHWLSLSVSEQQAVLIKQAQWDRLAFTEKARQRSRFFAWQSLGRLDQGRINAVYRQWQKLPLEKQQALRARFKQQLPEFQQAWGLGPTLGKDAQLLQDWLLFIPEPQIQSWLMLLRELNRGDLLALVQLGKRFDQPERDTFRTRLISAPASARSDMIQSAATR